MKPTSPYHTTLDQLTNRALEDFYRVQEAKPNSRAFYAARRRFEDSLLWLGREIETSIKENSAEVERWEFIKRKNLKMLNKRYNYSEKKAG